MSLMPDPIEALLESRVLQLRSADSGFVGADREVSLTTGMLLIYIVSGAAIWAFSRILDFGFAFVYMAVLLLLTGGFCVGARFQRRRYLAILREISAELEAAGFVVYREDDGHEGKLNVADSLPETGERKRLACKSHQLQISQLEMIREDRYRLVHPRWSIAENGEWRLESGNTGTTHPPQGSQG